MSTNTSKLFPDCHLNHTEHLWGTGTNQIQRYSEILLAVVSGLSAVLSPLNRPTPSTRISTWSRWSGQAELQRLGCSMQR